MQFLTGRETVFGEVPTGGTIEAFVQGSALRSEAFGDTGPNHQKHWISGADHRPVVHAVLTLAADDKDDLKAELARQTEAASRAGIVIVHPQDAELSSWPALEGVERVDVILPVPDEQGVNGESGYWLFHTIDGTQVYRRIDIAHDARHTSRRVGGDQPLSRWNSLGGVTHVDAVLPVPDQRRVDGTTQYWLFHTTPQGQRYRLISVADGGMHTDILERTDRDLTKWASLQGVGEVEDFLFVPQKYRVNGQTLVRVFHDDRRYRVISVADGPGHPDTLVRESRPNTPWFRRG
ncbi:hypothetical protein OIB37_27905 [Streptomyces sp. NBC_00820]|uniref:hypothetical protein n=1 Tax=Streptomyces sp. NBC_00820 TaxID=2975842 RepID=UPI002ED5D54A|nr:hypothetical protein OIB37_27905 [Streptomyces sp. NBC_00820]